MQRDDDFMQKSNNVKLVTEHALVVRAPLDEARKLLDFVLNDEGPSSEFCNALDEAQGAVHSDSAGQAYVLLVIDK